MLRGVRLAASLLSFLLMIEGPLPSARAADEQWSSTGGPPGQVYALVVDPTAPATLYVGTSTAGVFKSLDGGGSWSAMNEGLGSVTVFSLALDPTRPSTIYAGTSQGVYKSDNGGLSWSGASQGLPYDFSGLRFVYALAVNPQAPSTIYAGTKGGVYKTEDGGQHWVESNTGIRIGLKLIFADSLAVDPSDGRVLYAGAHYQGVGGSVFKSQDGGDSWVPLSLGLGEVLVSSITVAPQNPQQVYVATQGQGVFRSLDGGVSWQRLGTGVLEEEISAVAVAPQDPSLIYAAGSALGFYRSDDGGQTWQKVNSQLAERQVEALVPQVGRSLWAATRKGVFKSTDGGESWVWAGRGIASSEVTILAPGPQDADLIYVGAHAVGVYRSNDGGATWQEASRGTGLVTAIAPDPFDPQVVYAGMVFLDKDERGLYRSSDGGASWSLVSQAPSGLTVTAIALDTQASGRIYLGTEAGVFISQDAGVTWRFSWAGLPPDVRVSLLALDSGETSVLYLVLKGSPRRLYRSQDGGQSWAVVYTFAKEISALAPSPAAASLLYVSTGDAVLRSSDGGQTWVENPFVGEGTVLALAPHPQVTNTLYVGTTQGVYRSLDGSATWARVGPGLEEETVVALAVSPLSPSRIYAGTYGRGVWSYNAVPSLQVQPTYRAFLVEPGGPPPQPAPLSIRDASGGSFPWSGQSSPGDWLSLTPSSGTTVPITSFITVNAAGLAAGSYAGAITITSGLTGTHNSPQAVGVTLYIGPVQRRYLPWVAQGGPDAW